MLTEWRVFAPAKINLNLRVLPKRNDGFHPIESIFQTVNLQDELIVRLEDGKNTCTVSCEELELPQENTITVAYKAFCLFTGFNQSVSVKLIKRIPSGGGLGGGSSDAASFIKALAELSEICLSSELAYKIADKVGSDVFFFLQTKCCECALVSGRGEIVRAIQPRKDFFVLLVFPGVFSSTKEAYSLVDEAIDSGKTVDCPAFTELETVYNGSIKNWNFSNSFTPSLVRKYSEIGTALDALKLEGAVFADMSGSGSTVFGVFESIVDVQNAERMLTLKGIKCVIA